jgi:hypothetical protein
METLITFAAILVSLIGIDLAAALWGSDSREPMSDDHLR